MRKTIAGGIHRSSSSYSDIDLFHFRTHIKVMLRIEFSSLAIHLTVKKIQDDVLIQEEMGDDRTELQRK